jgi:hypothetical protein
LDSKKRGPLASFLSVEKPICRGRCLHRPFAECCEFAGIGVKDNIILQGRCGHRPLQFAFSQFFDTLKRGQKASFFHNTRRVCRTKEKSISFVGAAIRRPFGASFILRWRAAIDRPYKNTGDRNTLRRGQCPHWPIFVRSSSDVDGRMWASAPTGRLDTFTCHISYISYLISFFGPAALVMTPF